MKALAGADLEAGLFFVEGSRKSVHTNRVVEYARNRSRCLRWTDEMSINL